MKHLFWAALCGVLVMCLTGCGSSSPPALAVSCRTHRLGAGLIRTRVTVTNTTPTVLRAIVYGPALNTTRFIRPRYDPTTVYVKVGTQRRSYVGFIIPSVSGKKPAHVLFRLGKPKGPQSILATSKPVVQAKDWSEISNPSCTVK